ncbi:MAG: hypothetical protein WB818_03095 [Desulfobacterales bacterium]|jgi:hypothetical protein
MTPIYALSMLAVALYTANANPLQMPRIIMKINAAKELLFLISIAALIWARE